MGYLFKTRFLNKNCLNFELTRVYGIGPTQSSQICKALGFQKKVFFQDLKKSQLLKLRKYIEKNVVVGTALKRSKQNQIKNLMQIRSYRGFRHKNFLPCRGQRTSTNAKTQRRIKNKA